MGTQGPKWHLDQSTRFAQLIVVWSVSQCDKLWPMTVTSPVCHTINRPPKLTAPETIRRFGDMNDGWCSRSWRAAVHRFTSYHCHNFDNTNRNNKTHTLTYKLNTVNNSVIHNECLQIPPLALTGFCAHNDSNHKFHNDSNLPPCAKQMALFTHDWVV